MGTLSPSYFEKRTHGLLLNEEEDNQERIYKEQGRDNGGEQDGDDRQERGSQSSENETDEEEEEEEATGEQEVKQESKPSWAPNFLCRQGRDVYHYAGNDITIYESIDSYGAVMWPAALSLCSFLECNRQEVDLLGKTVLELGAGTGLVSIVSSLLGAAVTATDLPDVLGNLTANVMRNTRGRCRYTPQFTALSWGPDLEQAFPRSLHHYDYVLAADVVYHHDYLEELLLTMQHFCQPGTTLLWANKVRFTTDHTFTHNFQQSFHTQLLLEDRDMKIYKATSREEGDMKI